MRRQHDLFALIRIWNEVQIFDVDDNDDDNDDSHNSTEDCLVTVGAHLHF